MIWIHDNFLEKKEINYLLSLDINNFSHINNKDYKPLMADTAFSYRVSNIDLYKPIYDKLNELHSMELNEKNHILNMQYKKFEDDDNYALHAENPKIYGKNAYVLYLTNEIDGELIFPSKEDAIKEWSNGFNQMYNQFKITFLKKTTSVLPKINRCIIMKTGIAHLVRPCNGPRLSIAGWPNFKG